MYAAAAVVVAFVDAPMLVDDNSSRHFASSIRPRPLLALDMMFSFCCALAVVVALLQA